MSHTFPKPAARGPRGQSHLSISDFAAPEASQVGDASTAQRHEFVYFAEVGLPVHGQIALPAWTSSTFRICSNEAGVFQLQIHATACFSSYVYVIDVK